MTRKTILTVLSVIVAVTLGVGSWFIFSPANEASKIAIADITGFTITANDRTQGNPSASVVLIEYAAPVCPHCAEFNAQDFPILKTNYIDTGKVFYVFRVYPIRPGDGPAEKLASCLPKDKYFGFIDLLFRNQPKWDADEYPGANIHAGLVQMGRIAGMSESQVDACITSTAEDGRMNKVAADGLARYHLTGTPTFVINGIPGAAGEPWLGVQERLDTAIAAKNVAH